MTATSGFLTGRQPAYRKVVADRHLSGLSRPSRDRPQDKNLSLTFSAGRQIARRVAGIPAALGLRRSRAALVTWTVGPWVLMALAAIAHRYPFGMPRMVVFAAPPLLLAVSAGCVNVGRWLSAVFVGRHAPGMVAGALLGFLPALYAVNVPLHGRYWPWHEYPAVLERFARLRAPGEMVIVTLNVVPSVRYYAGPQLAGVVYVSTCAGSLPSPDFDHDREIQAAVHRAGPRLWILTTDQVIDGRRQFLLGWLRKQGCTLELLDGRTGAEYFGGPQLFKVTKPRSGSDF